VRRKPSVITSAGVGPPTPGEIRMCGTWLAPAAAKNFLSFSVFHALHPFATRPPRSPLPAPSLPLPRPRNGPMWFPFFSAPPGDRPHAEPISSSLVVLFFPNHLLVPGHIESVCGFVVQGGGPSIRSFAGPSSRPCASAGSGRRPLAAAEPTRRPGPRRPSSGSRGQFLDRRPTRDRACRVVERRHAQPLCRAWQKLPFPTLSAPPESAVLLKKRHHRRARIDGRAHSSAAPVPRPSTEGTAPHVCGTGVVVARSAVRRSWNE